MGNRLRREEMMRSLLALCVLVASSDALIVQPRLAPLPLSVLCSTVSLIRVQETPPPPPPSGRLGATVDQDGKSNVWAVEPAMKVEGENDKGIMAFAPVAGVALLALLSVPLLPLLFAANPDQAWVSALA